MGSKVGGAPVLLCADGSELAVAALQAGLALIRSDGRRIVVTVVSDIDEMAVTGAGIAGGVMSAEQAEEQLRHRQREGERIVDEAVAALGISDADTRVVRGEPGPAVCELARDVDAGIVVLGSRGRGAVKRVLLGSVSDYVARNAPCPVMITRSDST